MISQHLKDLKTTANLTNKEISKISNIPESTVARIMSGKAEDCNFYTIMCIVKALGGSLDEVAGIKFEVKNHILEDALPVETKTEKNKEGKCVVCDNLREVIADLKEDKKTKDRWLAKVFALSFVLLLLLIVTVFAVIFLAVDINHIIA